MLTASVHLENDLYPTYAEPFVPRVKLDERKQFYRKEMYR